MVGTPSKADLIHRLCLFIDVYGVCDDKKGDLEAIRLLPRKLMSQSRGMFDAWVPGVMTVSLECQ